jgi:hypothetical protein
MKTYDFHLWNDLNLNPDEFEEHINSLKENSIVNIFAAEEYDIKLGHGFRGWEILDKCNKSIQWNFVFGSSDLNFYLGRYQDEWNSRTTFLWPTFFINRSSYYLKNIDIKSKQDIDYLFISMNNLAREHRCYLIDNIFKNKLQKKSAITWHQENTDYKWQYWAPKKLLLSDKHFQNYHYNNQADPNFTSSIHQLPEEFFRSLFSLVSESSISRLFITEKTAIPLLMAQPFIVQGAPGFHSYLRDLGFELYDELFDYKFDRYIDYEKRTDAIIENIKRLRKENLKDLYKLVHEKTIRNRHRAMDMVKDINLIPDIVLSNKYARHAYRKELYQIIEYKEEEQG